MAKITRTGMKSFQKDLEKFSYKVLPEQVAVVSRGLAMDLLRRVVDKTPVGNPSRWLVNLNRKGGKEIKPKGYVGGHARMNWQVSLDMPVTQEISGDDASGGMAFSFGAMTIAQASPYQKIWIVNNVPYILVLENGRAPIDGIMRGSEQAPLGMLAVSLEELRVSFGAS